MPRRRPAFPAIRRRISDWPLADALHEAFCRKLPEYNRDGMRNIRVSRPCTADCQYADGQLSRDATACSTPFCYWSWRGLAMPTLVRMVTGRVAPAFSGMIAGVTSSTLQISTALSVAVIGGIFTACWTPLKAEPISRMPLSWRFWRWRYVWRQAPD